MLSTLIRQELLTHLMSARFFAAAGCREYIGVD